MGIITWLIKKVGKTIGRNTSSLLYSLIYREIFNEINFITMDINKTIEVMRGIGGEASLESLKRQKAILKFLPGDPGKVFKYFEVIWTIVFGMPIGEWEYEEKEIKGSEFPEIIIKIQKCPVCGGYGNDPEDLVKLEKEKPKFDGYACGFIGMIEKVINYLLMLKGNNYRMKISEEKCFAMGDNILQFKCNILSIDEIKAEFPQTAETYQSQLQKGSYGLMLTEAAAGEEGIVDKFRDSIDLEKLEEFFEGPLDSIKEKLSDLIRDKMHMEPEEFFDYFTNYERDLFKIAGYLGIHLLNEYGGVVENFLSNNIFARLTGYIFKQIKETYKIFIPLDVIEDYHQLFIDLLRNLAPEEMVGRVEIISAIEATDLILEGAQGALEDLGIDFTELKENIWDELKRLSRKEEEFGAVYDEIKERGRGRLLIQVLQEVLMLINSIFSLPIRMIMAREHQSIKTAIESTTSGGEVLESIKHHADRIFEFLEEMRS